MLSFYSSELDVIVEDPAFMVMPIDDRIINRAHGIFESMSINKFKFFNIKTHLSRLEKSATNAGISLPMSLDKI